MSSTSRRTCVDGCSEPRRRGLIEDLLREAGCEHLISYGANRFGSSVQWLTQWPITAEAVGVFTPGERDALFVNHQNPPTDLTRLGTDRQRLFDAVPLQNAGDEHIRFAESDDIDESRRTE